MSNNDSNFFRNTSNYFSTPKNRKSFLKENEEVYKLNFHNINNYSVSKDKENVLFSKFKRNQSIETPELFNSIDKVTKFLPSVANLINISKSKKIESMLFKRFEHQEFEKILKNEIKTINDKRNELKNIILTKQEELKKLDDEISDIQFSSKIYSNMSKLYLKSDNKKKVNKFSSKELSTPQFNTFANKDILDNSETPSQNTSNKYNNKYNIFNIKSIYNKDLKNIYNNTENNNNKKDKEKDINKNIPLEKILYIRGQEIAKLKKKLPQNKINRSKLSLDIHKLQQEKEELNNKKENLVEHLYLYYKIS